MAIHKKGQAHWEGDLKSGKGTSRRKAARLTNNLMVLIPALKALKGLTRKSLSARPMPPVSQWRYH